MELEYSTDAIKDLEYWKKTGDTGAMRKICKLISAIQENYSGGIGKPEELKGNLTGCWSRHIDKKNRIIYYVHKEENVITVLSLKGHYLDK